MRATVSPVCYIFEARRIMEHAESKNQARRIMEHTETSTQNQRAQRINSPRWRHSLCNAIQYVNTKSQHSQCMMMMIISHFVETHFLVEDSGPSTVQFAQQRVSHISLLIASLFHFLQHCPPQRSSTTQNEMHVLSCKQLLGKPFNHRVFPKLSWPVVFQTGNNTVENRPNTKATECFSNFHKCECTWEGLVQ